MAFIPSSGSVVAFQSNPSVLQTLTGLMSTNASVITVGTAAANQSVSGTVGASVLGWVPIQPSNTSTIGVIQGSVATVIIGGSIAASFTPPANQSVSGTIGASVIGYPAVNVGGSVMAFQGGAPWANTNVGSVITVGQGSIAVNIISGSIAASFTPPANQSVSGTVGASIIGLPPVNVTNTVTVVSSISGGIFPISGSVAATIVGTPNVNAAGSVVAFQGTTPWIIGSVYGNISGSVAAFVVGSSSVITTIQGSVAVAIISGSVAVATGNSSVMLLNGANVIGSVTTLQGTNPWVVVGSVYGNVSGSVVAFQGAGWSGSVAATIIGTPTVAVGGSVVSFQGGTQITSLVSTTPSSVQVGASIMGIAPVTLTANTIPPIQSILVGVTANTNGSVLTTTGYPQTVLQITSGPGASITGQVNFEGTIDGTQFLPIQGYNLATNAIASAAGIESNWAFNTAGLQGFRARVSNWTVGSITARTVTSPADARPFSTAIVGNPSVSGTMGASIIGQLPAGVAMIGSVAAYQGAVPWAVAGSVAAFQAGTNITSVVSSNPSSMLVGASIAGQLPAGTAMLGSVVAYQGVIPWTISSVYGNVAGSVVAFQGGTQITSVVGSIPSSLLTGNYAQRNDAVASFLGGNLTWNPIATDSAGRMLTKPFVSENATIISYTGSVVSGSVTLIKSSAVGLTNYITDYWVANTGSVTQLITFQDGSTSVLAYTITPGGGGSNSQGISIPLKTAPSQDLAFKATGTSSIVYITVKGYQAP